MSEKAKNESMIIFLLNEIACKMWGNSIKKKKLKVTSSNC